MAPGGPPTRAPTAAELLANPVVQAALDGAWIDSHPNDVAMRREQGGWIFLDLGTGALIVERADPGNLNTIDLWDPPLVAGAVVVAIFHTHPNPSAEGWVTGPSASDAYNDALAGVPDLIRADDGVHISGPDSRRGGLAGGPGFPP